MESINTMNVSDEATHSLTCVKILHVSYINVTAHQCVNKYIMLFLKGIDLSHIFFKFTINLAPINNKNKAQTGTKSPLKNVHK